MLRSPFFGRELGVGVPERGWCGIDFRIIRKEAFGGEGGESGVIPLCGLASDMPYVGGLGGAGDLSE